MFSAVNFSALAFYGKHRMRYRQLWEILGREWTYLSAEAVWGVQNVPGKDHGFLKIELTDDQRRMLLPVLSSMGFFRALDIKPGSYDELDVTGAKYKAIVERVVDIKRRLDTGKYTFSRIMCQFGQRPRTDAQDGSADEIIGNLSANVRAHPWVRSQMDKFGKKLFEGPFATEFELGILAWLVAYDGNVEVSGYEASDDTSSLPGIPLRTVASCTLTLPDGTPVVVLNAPAIKRPHGDPRPTTDSSTAYWLERYSPKPDALIVGVSGPTHGYRVARDFERRVHTTPGFESITVFGISRSAPKPMDVLNNALAEAIWLLQKAHEEWRTEA